MPVNADTPTPDLSITPEASARLFVSPTETPPAIADAQQIQSFTDTPPPVAMPARIEPAPTTPPLRFVEIGLALVIIGLGLAAWRARR